MDLLTDLGFMEIQYITEFLGVYPYFAAPLELLYNLMGCYLEPSIPSFLDTKNHQQFIQRTKKRQVEMPLHSVVPFLTNAGFTLSFNAGLNITLANFLIMMRQKNSFNSSQNRQRIHSPKTNSSLCFKRFVPLFDSTPPHQRTEYSISKNQVRLLDTSYYA